MTADSGRTWTESGFRPEFLTDGEWLVAAAFAKDGSARGVIRKPWNDLGNRG